MRRSERTATAPSRVASFCHKIEVCVFCHRLLQLTAVSGKNLSWLLERKLSIEGPVSRSLVLADLLLPVVPVSLLVVGKATLALSLLDLATFPKKRLLWLAFDTVEISYSLRS